MRGLKAKEIRRLALGDMSLRVPRVYAAEGRSRYNTGLVRVYRLLKLFVQRHRIKGPALTLKLKRRYMNPAMQNARA